MVRFFYEAHSINDIVNYFENRADAETARSKKQPSQLLKRASDASAETWHEAADILRATTIIGPPIKPEGEK